MPRFRPVALSLSILSILIFSTFCLAASRDRISAPIVAAQTTRLAGGVPMKARPEFDRGPVEASLKLNHVTLLTVPSPSQQKALNKLLADQQNPHSPSYHQWLTPEKYADRFGLSQNDIGKITAWLQSQGLTVVRTARGRNFVVFSGTAAQVESAFQTQIHSFEVDGESHFSNVTPLAIPTALSGIVVGVRGLSNFLPKSNALRSKHDYSLPLGGGKFDFFLAPGDIATMYDINPLYTAGIDGTGQKLAVIGETDVYLADINDFRSGFGLSQISGCTTTVNDVIKVPCDTTNFKYVVVTGDTDPGTPNSIQDDLPEADIDIEWSGATARNAQIIYVNAPDLAGSGVYDSMYFTIDNQLAPVMTMSYTFPCELAEAEGGFFAADEAEFQTANSEGITFLNSSGDTGAAECDYQSNLAINGYAVAYPASSPEVTGVGGTLIPHTEYNATYWSTTTGTDGGSALSYIPELVWNDAQEMGAFCVANPTNSFCINVGITSWSDAQNALGILAGGGGVSNCFTINGSNVCTGGFPQPAYQQGLSIPGQTTPVRFTPDVSLLASVYWPGFIICTAGDELGGPDSTSSCDPGGATGITNNLNNYGFTFGGTSISSPIFAGIVTLLNQYLQGSASNGLGNINPTLYALAATPSNGAFNPVITGNDGAYCTPGTPSSQHAALRCPSTGPNAGFLGYDASIVDPATNYNLGTGLGSVDANKLALAWAANRPTSTVTVNASASSVAQGTSVTFTATVAGTSPTGSVSFFLNGSSTALSTVTAISGVATYSTTTLPVGIDTITASYSGDGYNAPSTTATAATVDVVSPDFTLPGSLSAPASASPGQTTTTTMQVQAVGSSTFPATVTFACSGLPAGATCSFNPTQIASGASSPQSVQVTVTTAGPFTGAAADTRSRQAHNQNPRLWLPLTIPLAGVVFVGLGGRKISRRYKIAGLCLTLVLTGILVACGGGGGSTPTPVAVSVSPASVTTLWPNLSGAPSQTQQFTASVTGSTNTAVTWAVAGGSANGTIDSSGLYSAPTAVPAGAVTVTATSQADPTKSGSATVNIKTPTPAGTSTVTVTVTEGTVTHTTTFSLTVGS
jgi:subtilase family serine protease